MKTILKGTCEEIDVAMGGATFVIGERINPTGRKLLAASLRKDDLTLVIKEAVRQKEEGAAIIDVNVGAPGVDEEELLPRAVKMVAEATGLPVCIDSSNSSAIRKALETCPGRPLINSVTGEKKSLETMLPLINEFKVPVIALCLDEKGIPMSVAERIAVAHRILESAEKHDIRRGDIIFDPLVTTLGTSSKAAEITLNTMVALEEEFGLNMAIGASNVSHGLPLREHLTTTFVALAILCGVNLPIVNPVTPGLMAAIKSADLICGRDDHAHEFIKFYRNNR